MILNVFNMERKIQELIGEFDDNIYIIDSSIDYVQLSINNVFDWRSLINDLQEVFPQADFRFNVVGLVLTIEWWWLMRFVLKHRLDGTEIPFEMVNGNVTSEQELPVNPEDIVKQYRRGLIHGCIKMFVGELWEFEM